MSLILAPHCPSARIGSVCVLLLAGSPSAIAQLIVTRTVNAINRVVERRSRPHILQKAKKVLPAFTDCNSLCSVMFERGISRIRAARPHGGPGRIRGRVAPTVFIAGGLFSGVARKPSLGFFGVGLVVARRTLLKLSRVLDGVFLAGTSGFASQRLLVSLGQWPTSVFCHNHRVYHRKVKI